MRKDLFYKDKTIASQESSNRKLKEKNQGLLALVEKQKKQLENW